MGARRMPYFPTARSIRIGSELDTPREGHLLFRYLMRSILFIGKV